MATVPTRNYWSPGQNPTAAQLNQFYRDNFTWLRTSSPICRLSKTTVNISHNTLTLCSSYTEIDDNDSMHDPVTNPYRITFNTPGVYEITVRNVWATGLSASATSNYQWNVLIALNNAGSAANAVNNSLLEDMRIQSAIAASGSGEHMSFGFTDYLVTSNGTDYIEMWVAQNTTGAAESLQGNTSECSATSLQARWVAAI